MCKGYAMIADGLKMMAAGYELLANMEESKGLEISADAPKENEEKVPVETPKKEEKTVSVKDVRALMRQKIKDGKMEECQEILHSYGCDKLTDVSEDKLSELFEKVEVL